jgi:hypothetical protein
MNRIRLFAIGIVFACALPLIAQEAAAPSHMPSVDQHLKMLSERLTLTADQQDKARPIIAEMQDAMQKAMDDTSMTEEQKHAQMHSAFMNADKELRPLLTDEQKAKLDSMEKEHQGMHGQQ